MAQVDPGKPQPPNRVENEVEPGPVDPGDPAVGVTGDVFTYRLVVVFIGFALILTVIFISLIRLDGGDIPDSLVSLGSAAIGALGGFLVPVAAKKIGSAGKAKDGARQKQKGGAK